MFAVPALAPSVGSPAQPHIGAAVLLGLASAGCYATSVAVQHRYAARQAGRDATLVLRLLRHPGYWLSPAATFIGSLLHVAALSMGPLCLVQPLGVSELLIALPLGAALAGRVVTRTEWLGAAAVALGLTAVVAIAPHRAGAPRLSALQLGLAELGVVVFVLTLLVLSGRLRGAAAPVALAAGAASCFANSSAMARIALTGAGPLPLAASMAVLCGAAGFGLAQLAYRDGGLGVPLATQMLVDPLVAVTLGLVLLGERIALSPLGGALALAGLIGTAVGITVLSVRSPDQPTRAERQVVASWW